MSSKDRAGLLIGLILLLGIVFWLSGGLAIGLDLYQQSIGCETQYTITVEKMSPDESVHPPIEEVSFENLSTAEQELFQDILMSNSTKLYSEDRPIDFLKNTIVLYQGDRYKLGGMTVRDC